MLFRDKAEFKEVFDEFYNPLCNFVSRISGNESIVEDIVQDVFLHLWNTRHNYNQPVQVKALLFQACKNKLLEYLRKDKSYEKHIQNYASNSALSVEDDQLMQSMLQMEKINQSLRHLPTKCREVFEMHKFKGLSYSEIAEINNISIKTVENHMVKAIRIIREKMTNK